MPGSAKTQGVLIISEAATGGVPQEKAFLEISQNSQKNTCARVSFLIKLQAETCNFIKKESLAQVFFCELCEISKNTFFTEHLHATASVFWKEATAIAAATTKYIL